MSGARTDMLVVSHSGARAGAPMVLLRFLRWMRANTSVTDEVVLLHGGTMEDEFKALGARVVGGSDSRLWMLQHGLAQLGYRRASGALALARLRPALQPHKDIPLVLLNSVGALSALRFLPRGERRVVMYVHEMGEGFDRSIGEEVWRRFAPQVDRFVACASCVADVLVDRKGIAPERVVEHHGFVDRPRVEPLRTAYLRDRLGIPPDAVVIGAGGRLEWRKSPEVFVRVARAITRQRPDLDAHFVWLGGPVDGSPGWRMLHDIEAAGLRDRVHLAGEVRAPDDLMAGFDVFVLTSREDPFPLMMLEAGALGIPIVSFENGGAVELARAGGDDPLVDLVGYLDVEAMSQRILELVDDPERRARKGARLRDHVVAEHLTEVAAPRLFATLAEQHPPLLGAARVAIPDAVRPS